MAFKEAFSNKSIHELLSLIAAIYQLQNKNRFQIVAYQKAAESVERLSRELYSVWEEGKLADIPGFSASIGKNMDEYFKTGHSEHFESIVAQVPASLPVLMKVPGIGPKKAYKLISTFELYNPETVLAEVVKIAKKGKIAELESFGEKSQQDIKDAVELYMTIAGKDERMPYPVAAEIAEKVMAHMRLHPAVKHIDPMGSLRRKVSTIGDVDLCILASDKETKSIIDHFLLVPGKLAVDNAGDKKASIIFPPHVRVDLRVQDPAEYGAMLQYFTGSKEHNIKLRELGLKQGYSLNEYGIKDTKTGELHTFSNEKDFYGFLGLDYIEPEMREGTTEIDLAKKHELPNLIEVKDMKGDFHIHSSFDIKTSHDVGTNSYKEIVDKSVDRGYHYVGFADHNPRQSGLSEKEIVAVMQERKEVIHKMLKHADIPYFIGLEVDILPDGSLALPEAAFEHVDYLIASIHSAFTQSREEQTARVLKALSYPKVRIFGHPTGRLINKREGVNLDWDAVFAHVIEHDIALEINASTQRLDLPDMLVREGLAKGAIFSINSDAHATDHMDGIPYGVAVARRGWLEAKDVINTWPVEKLKKWITQE